MVNFVARRGGGSPPRHTTRRPYTTSRPYSSTYRTYSSTYRTQDSYQGSTTRRPYQSATTPRNQYVSTRRYDTVNSGNNNNNAGWNVPPRPGTYTTGSYHHHHSKPSIINLFADHGQAPQKIKIVNKYNYNYPGYYSLPVQNHAHPGYFYTPSSYHYGSSDTGSTALGFFLGYSLAKITTPTYSHYSFYDGYRPRYDHYEVHHYYHNKDSVPAKQEIQSNAIVGCVGDSVTICPANTTSLCTSSGALMCVVSATTTVPCTDNRQVNCVTSTIACVNNTAPECKNSQSSTTISIPCISNAEVHGDLKYVNNTIVVANATENSTTSTTTSTQYPITTTPSSPPPTQYPITTTPIPVVQARKRRDIAQNFCVTIVALPATKKETEGEVVLKDAQYIVQNFLESVFDL